MKTKVNEQWYNQTVLHLKNGITRKNATKKAILPLP